MTTYIKLLSAIGCGGMIGCLSPDKNKEKEYKRMLKRFLPLLIILFASGVLLAQGTVTFSGTVTDTDGEPVPGVYITVSDSKTATLSNTLRTTITGTAGEFSFSIEDPSGKTATFSHIGLKELSLPLGSVTVRTGWHVVMESKTLELDGVTVTALGVMREERSLGYAVTTVKGGQLDPNATNPVAALQGKVAGLNISGSSGGVFGRQRITLRGASTLGSNNQPLIVVDGVVVHTSVWETAPDWTGNSNDWGDELKNLNVSDIATISVLKGAAATALYGSRGMNGALVITTKGGAGAASGREGTVVRFMQSIGVDVVTSTPNLQTQYGPGTIAGDISYGQRNPDGGFYRWDTGQFYLDGSGNPTLIGANNFMFGPRFDGRTITQYDGTQDKYSAVKDGYRSFYSPAVQSNTNISVSGGTERTTFHLAAGYRYSDGTLPSESFSRGSVLFKGSHRIGDRVTVDAQVALSRSRLQNISPNIGDYYINRQVNTLYDPDYYQHKYKGEHGGIASSAYGDAYANVPIKDVWWNIYENSSRHRETNVRPAVGVNLDLASWLAFRGEAAANYHNSRRETKNDGQGYRNQGNDDIQGGLYGMGKSTSREETVAGTFTLQKQFGDFDLGGFVRGEYRNSFSDGTKTATSGGLLTPGLYSIGNSRNTPESSYAVTARKRVASAAFAVNARWREQLYMEVTGRNDWSSSLVYSDGSGNYSYFYPSVSASWVATNTFAERLPDWITFGKFRLSWAQVGNDATPFALNPGYEQKKYLQSDGSYVYGEVVSGVLLDGTLRPERKNAWEVGTDWRFLGGRIGFDFTFYKENTRDQILSIPIPKEAGTTYRLLNAGNIRNMGVELAINATPIKTKDWQWDIGATWARNRNKIISLHPDVQNYITLAGGASGGNYSIASVAQEGGPYGQLISTIAPARDDAGNMILSWDDDVRAAYAKRSGTAETLGSMMPDWTGGLSTGLHYKNVSLNVLLDVRWGGLIASYSNRFGTAYGVTESSLKYRDAANGGITWTSGYADAYGQTFGDGMIPDGVFDSGTTVTSPSGQRVDVSGMTFREAYEKGYVEPVYASAWHYFNNGWSSGTVNSGWVHEVKYIALREVSVGYRLPGKAVRKLGARNMNIILSARNLGYLYNSLPNNLNPESVMGTGTGEFRERGFIPCTATFMATLSMEF